MKAVILVASIILFIKPVIAQDYCSSFRYDTTCIFSAAQIDSVSLIYGHNRNWLGQETDLKLTLFFPSALYDTATAKPLIVLMHGGSFLPQWTAYSGSRYELTADGFYFARRGYVCASVDYRLGWNAGPMDNPAQCNGDNATHYRAMYRAVQDVRAAIRYLVSHAQIYRIDTSWVFVGGSSAGAMAANLATFANEADFETLSAGISTIMGGLDTASYLWSVPYRIRGVMSYKGAIPDTSFIKQQNTVPFIGIHGTADPYYPFIYGHAYSCPGYIMLYGDGAIAGRLSHLNTCYELNYKVNGTHANFYDANYTLSHRIAFLKRILCNNCRQILVQDQMEIQNIDLNLITISYGKVNDEMYNVYPNPVIDQMHVKYQGDGQIQGVIAGIYSVSGQLMMEQIIGENDVTLNLSDLPGGLYVIHFSSGAQSRSITFVKE